MNKYIIYCRKSSEQEDRQVLSIDSQTKELTDLAKKTNLPVNEIITEAKSAKIVGRANFGKMVSSIQKGLVNCVIVWHPDRLSRNPMDSATIVSLMDSGLLSEIVTPSQTFRNNPMDKMMIGFFLMQAKFENDSKGVNVVRGLKAKADKGWLPSGAKAGYINDKFAEKGNKTILPDPTSFPLIRKIWDLALTGSYSVRQMLKILNNDYGYRTTKRKSIGGKPMTISQIYLTLSDPFYYGEFEYPKGSGIWHTGKHQPMITKEEFDLVQFYLGKRGKPKPKTRSFSYTGLIVCGECGANITAEEKFQLICHRCKHKFSSLNKNECPRCQNSTSQTHNFTPLHYTYYHCTKRKDPHCKQKSISLEKLETEFDQLLSRIQISERFKNWAIKYINEANDTEASNHIAIQKSLTTRKAEIETKLNNLLRLKISPENSEGEILSNQEYKEQKDLLVSEKNLIIEKIDGDDFLSDKWKEIAEKTFNFACHARHWFSTGNKQEKREILIGLGANLELYDKYVRISLQKPFQFIETAILEEPTISAMLELKEKSDRPTNFESLWSQNPAMLPRQGSNLRHPP